MRRIAVWRKVELLRRSGTVLPVFAKESDTHTANVVDDPAEPAAVGVRGAGPAALAALRRTAMTTA
jgi:hypothetical protein